MKNCTTFKTPLTLLVFMICSSVAHAQVKCPSVDNATTNDLARYVTAKYHVTPQNSLTLKAITQANSDCYWKLQYEVPTSHRSITLYLTPDHKYLLPAIYARDADPQEEEHQAREEALKTLTAGHVASEGPTTSPVTIVEFSDFECPYCQRLTNMIEKDVLPNNPDVRVVFRNFPLQMHPWAQSAAQIAACAQMQGGDAFWKIHDYIFANQRDINLTNITEKLSTIADALPELDHAAFHACIDERLTMGLVAKDMDMGKQFDVHATPTVFINGTRVEAVRDSAQLQQMIKQARAGQLAEPATTSASATRAVNRPSSACLSPAY